MLHTLHELSIKGTRGRVLVSQYLNFSQPEALRTLLRFKNIELKISTSGNLHSKGYLFKKDKIYDLIIGSSNLTAGALRCNKEWNLKVTAASESHIILNALKEFDAEFESATKVDETFITSYKELYLKQKAVIRENQKQHGETTKYSPNEMQKEALVNLESLRSQGKTKALLISATGTGKTFLSAFDVLRFNPKKFLFVVHRANIA
jgi:phosphatidylserine/phosphatidylglycerophosphate/cardiolipin synthase-like enzyme